MTRLPKLSVLLLTYRQPEILLLTLRDLGAQDYPADAWELVVLDDGSRDSSAELAVSQLSPDIAITVRRMRAGGTYSLASASNELLRLADRSSEAFVHVEDVRLKGDFLRQHAKWHVSEAREALVTGPMCEGPAESFDPTACIRWPLMEMSGVTSDAYRCCFQAVFAKSMSYSKRLRDMLTPPGGSGPFDTTMTGWGYQETEFAFRAQQAGMACIYDTACAVYHPNHSARDESFYRGFDRAMLKSSGTARNSAYICSKHGLERFPEWRVGVPVESPMA